MFAIRQDEAASFDVNPQRDFTPLCPYGLPLIDSHEEIQEAGAKLFKSNFELELA